mgnify:FL=1
MKFETKLPFVVLNHRMGMKLLKDKIQDGGHRHLGFTKMSVTFERLERFQPNLRAWYLLLFNI